MLAVIPSLHAGPQTSSQPIAMRRIVLAAALLLACPCYAWAQQGGRLLALDPFGGVILPEGDASEDQGVWDIDGWDAGATIRFTRWLGVAASLGRHTLEDRPTHHFVAGPRITTDYTNHWPGVRGFAHVLAGFARTGGEGPSQSGPELDLGAGFDVLVFVRVQIDYVRLNFDGLPKNNARVFLGVVVPLCFRACRDIDGFDLSGRQTH